MATKMAPPLLLVASMVTGAASASSGPGKSVLFVAVDDMRPMMHVACEISLQPPLSHPTLSGGRD